MKSSKTKRLVISSMLLALGIVLPFFTGQIKEIGDSLLPMHMPVMLCGFISGPLYGSLIGLLMPVIRSISFGMPPLYPNAIWMGLELFTYGLITGLLYSKKKKQSTTYLYFCLTTAMIGGRIVWGISKSILLFVASKQFSFYMFIISGFVDALPGIILQLIFIPLIVKIVEKPKVRENK